MSKRKEDRNGYITVEGNPISKVGVYSYLGSMIPGTDPGDADKEFMVYRPAEELSKPETIESFKLMPFINEHTWLGGEDGTDPGELPLTGTVGEKVYFDYPYLRANLRWFSEEMKQALEDGKIELSPGYRYDAYYEPGVFEGQSYEYVMRNLRGNHLALVDFGRTGSDVAVMDSITSRKTIMPLEELLAMIAGLSEEDRLAIHKATGVMVEDEDDKANDSDDKAEGEDKAEDDDDKAEDEDDGPDADAARKKLEEIDRDDKDAKGEDDEDELKDKVAKLEDDVTAMDSRVIGAIVKRNRLGNRIAKHAGAFAFDGMTPAEVVRFGLRKFGLSAKKGQEEATLNGYLSALDKSPKTIVGMAQDSASKPTAMSKVIDEL